MDLTAPDLQDMSMQISGQVSPTIRPVNMAMAPQSINQTYPQESGIL